MDAEASRKARAAIIASRKCAKERVDAIQRAVCDGNLTYDFLDEELFGYLKCKFHLKDEDCITDNLAKLSKISLSRSMKVSPELVAEFDMAKSCDGTTSADAKIILFYMALQRELDVQFDAARTVDVDTIHDLSKLVWESLGH